jgi:uncharacterized membrane protein YraQ (UPF0718 family)
MKLKKEYKSILTIFIVFAVAYFLPVGEKRFDIAVLEAFYLLKEYAREHVILCLVPAFFIAGAISIFISKDSVMKYLGPKANKVVAYLVASVSGSILAVCSCTILPLFAGIYKMGAGLGPATAFLYSGPAINILAIVLSTKILGFKIGMARTIGAVLFSVIIGLLMHFIFKNDGNENSNFKAINQGDLDDHSSLYKNTLLMFSMVGILVFANFAKTDATSGVWHFIYSSKWILTSIFMLLFSVFLTLWYKVKAWKIVLFIIIEAVVIYIYKNPMISFIAGILMISTILNTSSDESEEWFDVTYDFALQILPLLFAGVLVAGFLLGRVGHEGIIPNSWIATVLGGNSIFANFFASFAGAFMYFATLTEVPIIQGLLDNGMGQGPALALLLAGPALSLPNMLVIKSIMGTKKTVVFVLLVVVMATISGYIFGNFIV